MGDYQESWYEKPFSPMMSYFRGSTRKSQHNNGSWRETPEGARFWQDYLARTGDTLSVPNYSNGTFTHLSKASNQNTTTAGTGGSRVKQSERQIVLSSPMSNTQGSLQPVRHIDEIAPITTARSASVPHKAIERKRRAAMAAAASSTNRPTERQTPDSRKSQRTENPGLKRSKSRDSIELEIDVDEPPELGGGESTDCGAMWEGLVGCFGDVAKGCGEIKCGDIKFD